VPKNRLILAVSAECERTAAGLRLVRQEEESQIAEDSLLVHVDFIGNSVELGELVDALKIGDRVRVLCNDGVLVAEKVSATEVRLIDSKPTADLIH
jgi:hypothetical protein